MSNFWRRLSDLTFPASFSVANQNLAVNENIGGENSKLGKSSNPTPQRHRLPDSWLQHLALRMNPELVSLDNFTKDLHHIGVALPIACSVGPCTHAEVFPSSQGPYMSCRLSTEGPNEGNAVFASRAQSSHSAEAAIARWWCGRSSPANHCSCN